MYDAGTPGHFRKEKGWDWRRALPSWTFNRLYMEGLPGWDLGINGHELSVTCAFEQNISSSRSVAIETDSWCMGQFYYRDHTLDTIPFLRDGEMYLGIFAFQLTEDYLKFIEKNERFTDGNLKVADFILEFGKTRDRVLDA